jgi:hypothetical protein
MAMYGHCYLVEGICSKCLLTHDFGTLDWTMAAFLALLSLKGHYFRSSSWMEVARGGWVCAYLIDVTEYLEHGARGSLCLSGLDGLVQGSGAV